MLVSRLYVLSLGDSSSSDSFFSSSRAADSFSQYLCDAIQGIFHTRNPTAVAVFFRSVMDFNGVDNRYGQTAVPDFIDYLCVQSHQLRDLIELSYTTRLQCSICEW